MKRYVSLEEISDGRLYTANDMVKADCHGCEGCSKCCQGMGSSIVLDPYDVYRMTTGLGISFERLLEHAVELNVVDGIVLPNLRMDGQQESCNFLNEEGRCSIHPYRPGICRLFPLGRYYGEAGEPLPEGFRYFLQTGECDSGARSKIKVSKWLDTPDLKQYEAFVNRWHRFINGVEQAVQDGADEDFERQISMQILQLFYLMPYGAERSFYEQFERRLTYLLQQYDAGTLS